jgi:hypothetical protein
MLGINYKDRETRDTIARALDVRHVSDKMLTKLELMDKGLELEQALELVDGKITPDLKANLKRQHGKWSLHRPDVTKLAFRGIKGILKGEPVEGVDSKGKLHVAQVQPHHILAAAGMVFDRVEPAIKRVQSDSTSVAATLVYVDLSSYGQDVVICPK